MLNTNLGHSTIIKKVNLLTRSAKALAISLISIWYIAFIGFSTSAFAQDQKKYHALSLTGTPKFSADISHFDYVNPDAPKGGVLRLPGNGTFDSLNPFTIKGNPASGMTLIYDQLMSSNLDQGSTQYCHLCEWVSYPDDYSSVTYKLREGPKFHDGKPVTPEDVIFSLEALKTANPRYGQYYKNVTRAEVTGDREVTFFFDIKNNRELPYIVGELYVLPKHFWTSKNDKGEDRDLKKTTLDAPLGSGPYKVGVIKPGQSLSFKRVEDYWAKDLYTAKGHNNFGEIRFEYFRDRLIAFEAFKADQFDFYAESSSLNWARNYEFNAIKAGKVLKRDDIVLKNPLGMQGFVFNIRRNQFKDIRVREALSRAFNFEWAAKNLFYNQYERTTSYFENSELASSGLPSAEELAILEPLKDELPAGVLTTEYKPFRHDGSAGTRKQLRAARKLLNEAGWTVRTETVEDESCGFFCSLMISIGLGSQNSRQVLRNEKGEILEIEFLIVSPAFERVIQAYVKNLKQLGVQTKIRLVDTPQYQRRLETYDYDVVISSYGQSESPGNEQRFFWGSQMANEPGGHNYIGINSPAIDKLVDKIIFAKDRAALIIACRALDRVLLFNHYMVPNWHVAYERLAYWNRLSHPDKIPSRAIGYVQTWWYDEAKAKAISDNTVKKEPSE